MNTAAIVIANTNIVSASISKSTTTWPCQNDAPYDHTATSSQKDKYSEAVLER